MSNQLLNSLLLGSASLLALTGSVAAQQSTSGAVETVVVTGSRVITDIANSPTPLTVVSTDQLLTTTPTDMEAALEKLPQFNDTGVQNPTNAGSNATGAVLNLRNFGAQRTLVLLDGHRVTPANANGTVDIDTLPQMLMTRVDVVTAGASSVYGSDAVTGVVNFVLDKNFDGVKFNLNSGVSTYGDAASYNAGFAVGTDLFGDRAHFEMSFRRFYQDGVLQSQRAQGPENWGLEGLGTAADPFTNSEYTNDNKAGSKIGCTGCAASGMQLANAGLIVPYFIGTPTGTANFSSGGHGGYTDDSAITATLGTVESFGRFSYDLDDTTSAYIQASANESFTKSAFQDHEWTSGLTGTFFTSNPYVPSYDQALLANPAGTFSVSELWHQGFPYDGDQSVGLNRNLSVTVGADGTLLAGRFNWDVFYTHGENRLDEKAPNNMNQQKMFAGEDAVQNSAGQIVCYVSTTSFASLYPGCVPADPFIQANYVNEDYNQWIGTTTYFHMTSKLDDWGGSITGDIFDLPAGAIKAALSTEFRDMSFGVASNANASLPINCTGLRICTPTDAIYQNNVVTPLPTVTETVWEVAGEANIPLLKDIPLVQSLTTDLAGRFTDYSVSGDAETWKIGLDWHVNDSIRFRATNSVDIRAPTLNDLFSPISQGATSFTDLLTSTTQQNQTQSHGNPNLVPEVARTYTGGVVLTPSFLPGFTASVDYYNIELKNAISSVSGTSTSVQTICIQSGGTSPFCALYVRPFAPGTPQYTTPANFPSFVLSESLNTAYNRVEGTDIEADYNFSMSDIADWLGGSTNIRLLANLQPVNETLQYVGAPLTFLPLSKGRVTGFITYNLNSWTFTLEDRWYSNYTRFSNYGVFYVQPRVPTRDYADIDIDKKLMIDGDAIDAYLAVQNIANVQPPIDPTVGSVPGLFYLGSGAKQYDQIGRYATIGIRAAL